ncbi:MAG: putative sugar O-methyltransferase [Pseudomonadota bacterium]
MELKRHISRLPNHILKPFGLKLVTSPKPSHDGQESAPIAPNYSKSKLPDGAADYLQPDNPKLKELQAAYANPSRHPLKEHMVWSDSLITSDDLRYFRGDNAYVWQMRGKNMNMLGYALTAYYVKAMDNLYLLRKLEEDDLFGIFTFRIDNKIISRDLLDSIIEIYFLERHLRISQWPRLNILDIGAGYGRLAHRFINALPNVENYFCTDAVAVSTFISDYYLGFRNVHHKAKTIPIYNIESALKNHTVDIAINVHSFSECTLPAVEWWLSLLESKRVKYLMIVPNTMDHDGKLLLTIQRKDFSKVIERHGYKLIAKEPKYSDECVQEYGIKPTYHYLYELT